MRELYPLQTNILTKLICKPSATFSELRTGGIENDLLNYHIKKLIKSGYLSKKGSRYLLTDKGTSYISQRDIDGSKYQLFKVSVTIYLFNGEKLLVQKRKRKPFINDVVTIAGKVKWGESLEDAAKRRLFQESGLVADFKFVGVLRKTRILKNGQVVEDTLYHSCYADSYSGELAEDNEYGENYWQDWKDAKENMQGNVDTGDYDGKIVERLANHNLSHYYYHQSKEIDRY